MKVLSILPWALCIILSTALVVDLSDHRRGHHYGSYETGFKTDLGTLGRDRSFLRLFHV